MDNFFIGSGVTAWIIFGGILIFKFVQILFYAAVDHREKDLMTNEMVSLRGEVATFKELVEHYKNEGRAVPIIYSKKQKRKR